MGSINRHSKIHNWHFSPWLSQAINALRVKLGHDPVRNYFGNRLGDTFSYSQTSETSGITKLPLELTRKYDMHLLDYSSSNFPVPTPLTRDRVFDLCILPVVKLPYVHYSERKFLYRFLAYCQGTSFAITAVHTQEEVELFERLLINERDLIFTGNAKSPIFSIFAKIWSTHCSENNNIFYKTEEHLTTYYNIIEDRRRYGNTVLLNTEISQYTRSVVQDSSRCTNCLTVSAIHRPSPPSSEAIISTFNVPFTTNASNQSLRRIAPTIAIHSPSTLSAPTQIQHITPRGIYEPVPSPLVPAKKRKRGICKVCSRNDCGGRSNRKYCVNKCGKCNVDSCPGRYLGRNSVTSLPCQSSIL